MFNSVSSTISRPQFDKILNDIIESRDLTKLAAERRAKNLARDTSPMQMSPDNSPDSPIGRLQQAINDHLNARNLQDTAVTEEKNRRINEAAKYAGQGFKGFKKQGEALSGAYPKVPMEPLKDAISNIDLDELMNIPDKVLTDKFQQYRAKTAIGKVFGVAGDNAPLQPNEINLLKQVFGDQAAQQLVDLHGGLGLVADANPQWNKLSEVANLSKSMQSSIDLSAPLRQGAPMMLRKEYYPALMKMFSFGRSEAAYQGLQDFLTKEWPERELAEKSGLAITKIGSDIGPREEHFLSSLPEKIPGFGRFYRGSERAYVGFIDKLRSDVFSSMIKDAEAAGFRTKEVMKSKGGDVIVPTREAREIAKYINTATGRGSLGRLEKYGDLANALMYSPRFQASRIQLLTKPFNASNWASLSPIVRKEYLKSILAVGGLVTTANGLGYALGGKLTANPTSSDFGKVRFGNTRLDPGGGFLQYLTLAAREATGKITNPVTGKVTNLGEGYKAPTRLSVLGDFARQKEAPGPSFVTGALSGKNAIGQPFNPESEIAKSFISLFAQDFYDLAKEDPWLLPLMIPGVLGMGVSTFEKFQKQNQAKQPEDRSGLFVGGR